MKSRLICAAYFDGELICAAYFNLKRSYSGSYYVQSDSAEGSDFAEGRANPRKGVHFVGRESKILKGEIS